MALANVAVLLAQLGKRILVVDWDLEAPGIERYFENLIPGRSEEVGTNNGVLELAELISSGQPVDWKQSVISFPVPGSGRPLHLLSAGRRDSGYVGRLQRLNWEDLFESHDFASHLEAIRDEWLDEYDYVLIDSRTGITDIGGICTIYLPDILVALFTANYQSVEGVADVVTRARRARSGLPVDRAALICIPVPARDESRTEYEQSLEWRKIYFEQLSDLYVDFLPKDVTPTDALNLLRLPNVPYWSFGERLPVLTESASDPSGITYYYTILAKLLATGLSWQESAPAQATSGVTTTGVATSGTNIGTSGGEVYYVTGGTVGSAYPVPESGYLDQVRDIAPIQLVSRDDELEELAAFCAGDEPYVWWQGSPWSGKTALMSWFVLHPPPGVDVLSFFVTGRLAGQDDSSAFTEALLAQLASYLGEVLPASVPVTAREPLRKRLLNSAVERAEQAGRKLVLVVDGLDEDQGQSAQAHLPSIASQLPRPEENLRVIVAGRPSPALPSDVPASHPLHECPVKRLVPFAGAETHRLAKTELRDLISGDMARQDVVGCLTASRGGLSSEDLEELTSLAPYQLDLILQGTAGRSIAHRTVTAGDGRTEDVYLLAHDALLTEASHALGEKILDGYRTRIHAWADSFRKKHWPDRTSTYLILGYPRMLVDEGNIERLTEYALDEARHDLLRRRTGGDAATLSEISLAQDSILSQPEPDVLSVARLAFHKINIDYLNGRTPIDLPSVHALTGSPGSGRALARSIPGPFRRVRAMTELSCVLARSAVGHGASELAAEAEAPARSIADPYQQALALGRLATAMVEAGRAGRADVLARSIAEPSLRAWVLSAVASALAAAGNLGQARDDAATTAEWARALTDPGERATALTWAARAFNDVGDARRARSAVGEAQSAARSITDPAERAWTLAAVVRASARSGAPGHARSLADEAETAAGSIADPAEQAWTLAALARTAAGTGDNDHARTLARDALEAARSIADPAMLATALASVAWALAAIEDYDKALTLAHSIADPAAQAYALAAVTGMLAAGHQYDRAESLARLITDPAVQASVLATLARALADAGNLDRARSLAHDAESAAHADTGSGPQARTLAAVARALAQSGRFDQAERLARSIAVPAMQASALAAVARALADSGDPDRAEHLAHSVTDPAMQASALAAVARALADSGDPGRAEHLARSITDPAMQASALAAVARAATDRGDLDQARSLSDDAEAAARSITDPGNQAWALATLTRTLAETDNDRAETLAGWITDPAIAAWALALVARAVARKGDRDRARLLATDAAAAAQLAAEADPQAYGANALTRALAAMTQARSLGGDDEQSEAIAPLGRNPETQTLTIRMRSQASESDHSLLDMITSRASGSPSRSQLLSALSRALTQSGDFDGLVIFYYSLTDPATRVNPQSEEERADSRATHSGLPLEVDARGGEQDFIADTVMAAAEERSRSRDLMRAPRSPQDWAGAVTEVAEGAWAPRGAQAARRLVAAALAYGPWGSALQALGQLDPEALAQFADDIGRMDSAARSA